METDYDVAIIGGGPAGSTAATLLARHGRKVVVLEREKFPRFHIGESLLPYSMTTFERLGVQDKLKTICMDKIGGEVSSACGTRKVRFYFRTGFRLEQTRSYQVKRSDFDKLLLDHAAEAGAEVREETPVEKADFAPGCATVHLKKGGALTARYVLDCSGRNAIIGNQFKLRKSYETLQKFSVFAHFENVPLRDQEELNLTRLIRGGDYWFWMIAVHEDRVSVGVVTDTAKFRKLGKSPEEALEHFIQASPEMRERMAGARRVSEVYAISDYSYHNISLTGDRWMLAGDAAGFIDPIFSTGVFLAILSGEQCADIIHTILDNPGKKAALFRNYERGVLKLMNKYIRFIHAWYRPEFIEIFTNPVERLNLVGAVNAALAGNMSNSFAMWWRMELFYFILFLQRHFPLVPRLPLITNAVE
ncbi:MAG TPA: NAD(P)/FAD-dependent oxidoreductase [Chthoniobacteraceae bacterium]|jgi:FADH2-dependent halogenase|nr:NAD(P)/FAD-dependent oxidoreductase [Chthoniobacteraceae bacterium]